MTEDRFSALPTDIADVAVLLKLQLERVGSRQLPKAKDLPGFISTFRTFASKEESAHNFSRQGSSRKPEGGF
jgi:hypothetical protein